MLVSFLTSWMTYCANCLPRYWTFLFMWLFKSWWSFIFYFSWSSSSLSVSFSWSPMFFFFFASLFIDLSSFLRMSSSFIFWAPDIALYISALLSSKLFAFWPYSFCDSKNLKIALIPLYATIDGGSFNGVPWQLSCFKFSRAVIVAGSALTSVYEMPKTTNFVRCLTSGLSSYKGLLFKLSSSRFSDMFSFLKKSAGIVLIWF